MIIDETQSRKNGLAVQKGAVLTFIHKNPFYLRQSSPNMIASLLKQTQAYFMMQLTIIGFGNQAQAWAQNLKDSGFSITIGLRPQSPSFSLAKRMGFECLSVEDEAFYDGAVFALLIPDHLHEEFLARNGKRFKTGSVLLYAHGFSNVDKKFHERLPELHHVLFAPKAIATEIRKQYLLKGRLGGVYSLEHIKNNRDSIEDYVKKLANALGLTMGIYPTTFLHETQADLYSEQGLLCSVVPYTAKMMFEHLVQKGIEPELAYFECWHELKLIVNAMVDVGPEKFFNLISPNALAGSEKGFSLLSDKNFEGKLLSLFKDIQNGTFEREISVVDVDTLRKTIKARWEASPLQQTFNSFNPERP